MKLHQTFDVPTMIMTAVNIRFFRVLVLLFTWSIQLSTSQRASGKQQPHIVLIVADDLGWNDIGFHGADQIPTPNIDALAYNGIILNRHYVQPVCSPSRAALLTGKYPFRYGLQGKPISPGSPSALPLNEKILPQHLKDLGYSTHLVGKWHLGSHKKEFTPTQRGFDSHFGYWNGYLSYTNSTLFSRSVIGKDARRGLKRAGNEMENRYATEVFTEEAQKVIESCKQQQNPMFLMLSHLAVHSGNPGPNHLEVPNITLNNERFNYIGNESRRLYAGMVTSLDESVGVIIESLDKNEMLKNTIILFMSDNGGPTTDFLWGHGNSGSNFPLRGEKGSVLEGGVRGVAAIWSPWLKNKHSVFEHLFHVTDWLPTLYTAAGGDVENLGIIDGLDQWRSFTDIPTPIRSTILINIDEIRGDEALIFNQWKIVKNNRSSDQSCFLRYGGDPGLVGPRPHDASPADGRLLAAGCAARPDDAVCRASAAERAALFRRVRDRAAVHGRCAERETAADPDAAPYECFDGYCLFDVLRDPCEWRNVAAEQPEALRDAARLLDGHRRGVVPQQRPPIDPGSDPRFFGGYWDTWLDTPQEPRQDL